MCLGVWATLIPMETYTGVSFQLSKTFKSFSRDWENDEIKSWDGLKG